ncbi:MAG TPA: HAD family hydrolase [Candidatus Limnocylindrales bacterium]|nr:HAD family hydrolase [Candidatus Limnocylindrales bacterium]
MDPICFDWDGTLFDSIGALYRANVAVMAAFGLPFDEPAYRRHFDPDWRVMYRNLGVPGSRLDEANAVWHARFDADAAIGLLPGAAEALETLAAAGHPLGLVTSGHRSIVEPQLRRTGLDGRFAVCVFGDRLPVHKPDPAPLRLALRELGVADAPERAIHVGDTPADMTMARRAGTRAVGVASLLGDPDALRQAGAEEVWPSVAAWVQARAGAGVPRPAPDDRRSVGEGAIRGRPTEPHRA